MQKRIIKHLKLEILSIFISLFSVNLFGSDLPTLDEALRAPVAPIKIQATGKRESLEKLKEGKIDGEARYYHPNGQLYTILNWINGLKEGKFKLYRENGSIEQYHEFHNGKPHGVLIWMKDDESIDIFAEYVDGVTFGKSRCVNPISFNEIFKSKNMRESLIEKCTRRDQITPSFDCKQAYTKSEKMICDDHKLSYLDRLMNIQYSDILRNQNEEGKSKLKTGQRAWLKEREKCSHFTDAEFARSCIIRSMVNRLRQIKIFDPNKNEDFQSKDGVI